ncbi:hypothetical protein ABIG05_000327 [Bradyrhizobium japonicum]
MTSASQSGIDDLHASAASRHPDHLINGTLRIGQVLEHPVGAADVERLIGERQLVRIRHAKIHRQGRPRGAPPGFGDGCRIDIDARGFAACPHDPSSRHYVVAGTATYIEEVIAGSKLQAFKALPLVTSGRCRRTYAVQTLQCREERVLMGSHRSSPSAARTERID